MLRTLCSGTPLLGIAILVGGATLEAGVRDLFSKPTSTPKPAAVATRSKAAIATVGRTSVKSNARLLAQADAPLDRLRQRDPEQRFRDVMDEDELFPNDAKPAKEQTPSAPKDALGKQLPDQAGEQPNASEPGPIQPPDDRVAALPQVQPDEAALPEPVTSPENLKKIGEIQPFFDYHPATALKGEVCWNLCPRPDGMPCKPDENGLVPECPAEFRLSEAAYSPRLMTDCLYQWRASDMYHNPLYFEDPALERYGHVHWECVQPFVSVAKFSTQLAGLPYQMTIDPVCKKMYPLGYYRPGECAPKKYYRIPWNTHAALAEAGVWTGLFFIFP